ncbi:MAG: DUF2460 domain-containing protein [Rhodobacteraceae bacterium]|nr:DUF2460 domain-containing protein [Paracoccaceae bacterium]
MAIMHDVRLPESISNGAQYSTKRRTEISVLANGNERRSTPQRDSRRSMNIAFGIRRDSDVGQIVDLWEIVQGELFAFRVQWPLDFKSCDPRFSALSDDQLIGVGDGAVIDFQLVKTISIGAQSYVRNVTAIVADSILVAVDGLAQVEGVDFTADYDTGIISFTAPVPDTLEITAGYEFDLIMRFQGGDLVAVMDSWAGDGVGWDYGSVPEINLVEVDK